MGGINHQPCNRPKTAYLKHSTRMSRAVSTAHRALESANVFLEDVILAELDGKSGTIGPVISELNKSRDALSDFRQCIKDLSGNMEENKYTDLPTLHTADLVATGEQLDAIGIVQFTEWCEVLAMMKTGSFYSVLRRFDNITRVIHSNTEDLIDKISRLDSAALRGSLNLIMEENREGNIKVEFARLYTTWNRFHRLFLASSILSTELWYAFTQRGSLLGGEEQSDVA